MLTPSRHKLLQFLLLTSLVALVVLPAPLLAQTLSDTPWTHYFGSSTGPHIGWGHASRIQNTRSGQIVRALERGDDIVLGDDYGLGDAKHEDAVAHFMDSIEADGGESFRQEIFDRAIVLEEIKSETGEAHQVLVWQFGNEITSINYTLNLRSWAEEPVQPAKPGDPFVIPYYAEYYLGPAVQAIQNAEAATGSNIPVMLGSIGNANNPARREFLYDLLNYQLVGAFANTLAGQRVADFVDYIDVHYIIAKDTHVEDDRGRTIRNLQGSYKLALSEIYDAWVAPGILEGLWSTEEIGRSVALGGYAAATTMVVTARYLHWWGENGQSVNQARALFFGTNLGLSDVSADLAMQALFAFLGSTPLTEVPDAILPPASDWESYLFESVEDTGKRVGFVIPSWSNVESGAFTTFEIDSIGWPGEVSAEVLVFGLGASYSAVAIVERQADVLRISVPTAILIEAGAPPSIVIFLERN